MPRIVPSQVIELIDQLFPRARTDSQFTVHIGASANLGAVVSFARKIPSELLMLTGQDLADYVVSLSMMDTAQRLWLASPGPHLNLSEYRSTNPIVLLRQALLKCPDEAPSPTTAELSFIPDTELRESIRRDISAANQDLANGEWKGATVLAGSATEALLLWVIKNFDQSQPGSVRTAVGQLVTAVTLPQAPNSNPDRWGLFELIEVALHLALISPEAADQARLGKDFRNLIHPGRAARLGQVCDRATALSALAAAEHVVRDLTP